MVRQAFRTSRCKIARANDIDEERKRTSSFSSRVLSSSFRSRSISACMPVRSCCVSSSRLAQTSSTILSCAMLSMSAVISLVSNTSFTRACDRTCMAREPNCSDETVSSRCSRTSGTHRIREVLALPPMDSCAGGGEGRQKPIVPLLLIVLVQALLASCHLCTLRGLNRPPREYHCDRGK